MIGINKGGFQWQNWDMKNGYKTIQWRSTVSAPLCAICNKSVYPAEEVTGAGQKFHKLCLKCTACNTLLNSGNLNEREKKIYCMSCYRRQFGPQGAGRGLATSLIPNIDTPPSSPSLDQTEININNYQEKTSIGSSASHTSLDDDSHHSNDRIITQEIFHRPSSINLTAFKMMSISGNICPRCSKTVYVAEEVKAAGKSFHKRCYTCANCKGSISNGRYCEHDGELYDNNCYQRLFGPKGILSIGN